MTKLPTHIRTDSAEFKDNAARMQVLVDELRARSETARQGGGPKYIERHRAQGKMPVRERVETLLDEGSPFLELSPLAAWEMYDGDAPGAGVVTGIGRVSGREVLIVANDATVKGGTYYPMTVKKHVRAQEVALQNRPILSLEASVWRHLDVGEGGVRPLHKRPNRGMALRH